MRLILATLATYHEYCYYGYTSLIKTIYFNHTECKYVLVFISSSIFRFQMFFARKLCVFLKAQALSHQGPCGLKLGKRIFGQVTLAW